MTSWLMSSPPISISHRLFCCSYSSLRVAAPFPPPFFLRRGKGAAARRLQLFKFQRRSCKVSLFFPPRRQSAPKSLLASYFIAHETLEWDGCRNLLKSSFLFTPRVNDWVLVPTFESLDEILWCDHSNDSIFSVIIQDEIWKFSWNVYFVNSWR